MTRQVPIQHLDSQWVVLGVVIRLSFQVFQPPDLGGWSRGEVGTIDFEPYRLFGPGIEDTLEGRSPAHGFVMLGEVEGDDEGRHTGFEHLEVRIADGLDGGPLGRVVHALGPVLN